MAVVAAEVWSALVRQLALNIDYDFQECVSISLGSIFSRKAQAPFFGGAGPFLWWRRPFSLVAQALFFEETGSFFGGVDPLSLRDQAPFSGGADPFLCGAGLFLWETRPLSMEEQGPLEEPARVVSIAGTVF